MNSLSIEGDLNFSTVESYLDKVKVFTFEGQNGSISAEPFTLDFSVSNDIEYKIDSAGVAFCLHCLRESKQETLKLIQPSDRLISLLKEYKLTELFEVI